MTKFLDTSFRYASVLGNEVEAHATSSFSSVCEDDFVDHLSMFIRIDKNNLNKYVSVYRSFVCFDDVEPESFESGSPFSLLRDYIREHHLKLAEEHSNLLIQFCSLLYWLYNAKGPADLSIAIVSFVSSIGYNPVTLYKHFSIPSDVFDFSSSSEVLPEAFENVGESWKLLKSNPIFPKLSTAFTVLTALTVCCIERENFDGGWINPLLTSLKNVHYSSFDMIDALIESFCWMSSTGVAIIKTRSLSPLLYSNSLVRDFDEKFLYVQAEKTSAINGSLDDLATYETKLNDCIRIIERLNDCKIDFVIRRYLHEKFAILYDIQNSLVIKRRNCEIRFCPIGFSLFGGSGVGKTTVAKLIMRTSLATMGFPFDDKHQITLDMNDKYHSTLTNDTQGIYFDDLANTTSAFADNGQIPSNTIIKFFNNVPAQAVKADVSDKGKTMINLKCGVVTTNCKDLDAPKYSNCPASILRRLFHITVTIKPEYQQKVGGISNGMLDPNHPKLQSQGSIGEIDVWFFKIEVAIPAQEKSFVFAPYIHVRDGVEIKCDKIGLRELLHIVRDLSVAHKKQQENLLTGARNDTSCICASCTLPRVVCECEPQSFSIPYLPSFASAFGYVPLSSLSLDKYFPDCLELADKSFIGLSSYVPECVYNTSAFQYVMGHPISRLSDFDWSLFRYIFKHNDYFRKWLVYIFFASIGLYFSFGWHFCYTLSTLCIVLFVCILLIVDISVKRRDKMVQNVLASRQTLSLYSKRIRDDIIPKSVLAISGIAAIILAMRYMYFAYATNKNVPQGSSLDSDEIDKQPGWFGSMFRGNTQKISAMINNNHMPSQLSQTLQKNLFFANFRRVDGTTASCCVFMPKKCILLFPKHIFYANGNLNVEPSLKLDIDVQRHNSYGSKFSVTVEFSMCKFYGDISVAYFPNCPDLKDAVKVFCDNISGSGYCELVRRLPDFSTSTEKVYAQHGQVGHKYMKFFGSSYQTTLSGSGACMSVLINDSNPSYIVGFHIGGTGETGVSIFIGRSSLEQLIKEVIFDNCGIEGCEGGDLPVQQCGKPLVVGPVHHSAYCKTKLVDTCFEVYGKTQLRTQTKSQVERGYLYDIMVDHFGLSDQWKAPNMLPNWKHYNVFVDKVVQPSGQFLASHIKRAIDDYVAPLIKETESYIGLRRPLTFDEGIMGIKGMRFCDALIMNTSMGFPVFGKKRRYFSDVNDDNGLLIKRVPDNIIIQEYDRLKDCYLNNRRGYPVFTACLKDEVKELDSEKVRVFTACPVAFSILVRQYYLPIAIFLQHFPLLSEMAVGVNAFGLQWQDLMDFTDEFGDENGGKFGMDYSGYDTRMNSQMSRSVYFIMVDLARHLGYDNESLKIMSAMVDDLTHPLVDINGTLFGLFHMNPSGNNVTVQVNCIANSLYMRLAFFHYYPQAVNFNSCVHLMTYGDDNKCSVRPEFRKKFSFLGVQDFLGKHDIKITPPDKKSSGEAFFDDDKLDFLKRQSSYIPEIDRSIGKLEENSIFKSLMYNVRSASCSKRDVALSCIDSAFHEWFAFGQDYYESKRKSFKEALSTCGLGDYPILNISYDDRVSSWKEQYVK